MIGEADLFFENRGDGTFVEATDAHGLTDAARAYGFGVVATDYDDDGWVDLYVANDTAPNFLYRNRGDGRFESVGLASGVALNAEGRAQAGMGVDSGDYDGDGHLDFIVTNFAHDTDTLYRNRDGRQFEDVTDASGLAGPTFVRMGWGTALFDADLDGDLDLFFANGHIYPNVDDYPELKESFRQKNQLFLNDAARFIDVSETAGGGLQVAKASRGLAVGDLDNDGDLDLVVSNMDDVPTLLENRQAHWTSLGGSSARRVRSQSLLHRRTRHDRCRRDQAGAGDSVWRQLSLAKRPTRVLRAWLVQRHRGRRGPDARRSHQAVAAAAD